MKITGITAEYNPLHNGHVYHIQQTRRETACDAVVVAMSGNYVQRGQPAIIDKWKRTECALKSGADLVIEIPTLFCLGNASQYASASVSLLESMGCDSISFGSECGDQQLLRNVSGFLYKHKEELQRIISEKSREGMSYPAARAEAYRCVRGEADPAISDEIQLLSQPNDILALEYLMSMSSASPVIIKRRGAGYNTISNGDYEYLSAAAIRASLHDTKSCNRISECVPEEVLRILMKSEFTFADNWSDHLRFAVMTSSVEQIEDCPSGGEGLANALKSSVKEFEIWDDIIKNIKSKRYTYTRLSRLCMQIVLGISRDRLSSAKPEYIRVLGFNETGRSVLAEAKKNEMLPIITNINKETNILNGHGRNQLDLDVHASDIYNLITGRSVYKCSDYRMQPVIQ